MDVAGRHIASALMLFVAAASLAAHPGFASADRREREHPGRLEAALPPADLASPPAATAAPTAIPVPPVRELPNTDAVSGAEPDPESFDRIGLEIWWRRYEERRRNAE